MPRDLLLEVGTEEIPAGFLARALVDLKSRVETALADARLRHGELRTTGTPRRLCLTIEALVDRQEDVEEEMVGPPARVAFDEDGKPTKAAEGFAKRNGVALDELRRGEVEGKKGEYLLCTRRESGKESAEVLVPLLDELLSSMPWPKSMRWNWQDEAFVRPVHWLVCLLGGEILPVSYAGIKAGNRTRGHRFLAPDEIELDGTVAQYQQSLREAFVVVDTESRRTMVRAEIARLEKEHGATVRPDDELVDEVTNLVEYPVGICGQFKEDYLEVPEEVIVSAMRSHQRYFAMNDADGKLVNRFVTIAGTVTKDPAVVRSGNERVLAARLSDAQFFFREDRKNGLDHFATKLDNVVFQKKIGTIGAKIKRIVAGSVALGGELGLDEAKVQRAAALCKADLSTQMVYEFPDLQGTMGRYYATLAGEDEEVCAAIEEHYMPRGASDDLPASDIAGVVGLADRLDTMVGCFAVGLAPTGSADPYGLRRAALGILRLLSERKWSVDLSALVARAAENLRPEVEVKEEHEREVLEFLRVRFRGLLSEGKSLPGDCVDAALAVGFWDPRDARARAEAVSQLRQRPDFDALAAAFKRVANILKGQEFDGTPKPEAFVEEQERSLWTSFEGIRERVDANLDKHDYMAALQVLSELKGPVDAFFDAVLVMDKDESIRDNRLAMLGRINATFTRIADFRQLAV